VNLVGCCRGGAILCRFCAQKQAQVIDFMGLVNLKLLKKPKINATLCFAYKNTSLTQIVQKIAGGSPKRRGRHSDDPGQ
jgi:hypothetical protein